VSIFIPIIERLASDFGPASVLFESDAFVFDIGIMPTEAIRKQLSSLIERCPQGSDGGTNFVRLGEGQLRSGSSAALSLHQEGYYHPEQPKYIFLYCVESDDVAGQTTVASCRPLLADATLREVGDAMVRFYRSSLGEWTPWRPIVEYSEREPCIRFALPDVHRQVEVRNTDLSVEAIGELVESTTREVMWRRGLLLAVNNWMVLHGRRRILAKSRTLFRLIF
jgi:alpha-ketoglutarate-dependent taurine dioxygenase